MVDHEGLFAASVKPSTAIDGQLSPAPEWIEQAIAAIPREYSGEKLGRYELCHGCGHIGEHAPDCWCVVVRNCLEQAKNSLAN